MKNNIKWISFVTILANLSFATLFAQQPAPKPSTPEREARREERQEKIEALRVGFLTQELNLTSAEAEKFWPLFNQFQAEMRTIRQQNMPKNKREEDLTPEERANVADKILETKQRVLDLEKKYHAQFKSILGNEKLAKLYEAERKFKQTVMQKLRERREKAGGNRERPMQKPERD